MTSLLSPRDYGPLIDFVVEAMKVPYDHRGLPGTYNCYTLFQKTQKELFGRELPDVILETDTLEEFVVKLAETKGLIQSNWQTIERPIHGCAVQMSHSTVPHHVGTYLGIQGGGVLHAQKGAGVCFDSIQIMKAAGWRHFIYDIPRN
jgi:hypothetical protein